MKALGSLFVLLGVAASLAPSAAAAKVYVDENFDAGKMPDGWSARTAGEGSANYGFVARAGGYCYWAAVTVRDGQYGLVELKSRQLAVPVGTLYYLFDFTSYSYGTATVGKRFFVRYDGSSNDIKYVSLPTNSDWHVEGGSFYVGEAKPIIAYWAISAGAAPGRYGTGSMGLDNVKLFDEASVAVAPASLGRVKALFR